MLLELTDGIADGLLLPGVGGQRRFGPVLGRLQIGDGPQIAPGRRRLLVDGGVPNGDLPTGGGDLGSEVADIPDGGGDERRHGHGGADLERGERSHWDAPFEGGGGG